jgi:hypothetical protein
MRVGGCWSAKSLAYRGIENHDYIYVVDGVIFGCR